MRYLLDTVIGVKNESMSSQYLLLTLPEFFICICKIRAIAQYSQWSVLCFKDHYLSFFFFFLWPLTRGSIIPQSLHETVDQSTLMVSISFKLRGYGMVFNATFNNISVISWRSVALVEYPKKPQSCCKSLTNFLTQCCIKYTSLA